MSVSTLLLKQVCDEIGLMYSAVGSNDALLKIHFGSADHIVLNAALGLNTDAELKLSQDKYYTYQLLSEHIPMPRTASYIDPNTFDPFIPYITYGSELEIFSDIKKTFSYPLIIKRNSGTQGKNVFLCHDDEAVIAAIHAIYSKKQIEYDHVLLAEVYVPPKREFRVIILDGHVELIYHKDNSSATFDGNLSPLHWKNAVSRIIEDDVLYSKIQELVSILYTIFPISYAGLDLIESSDGNMWLIEVNSTPQFGEFIKSNQPDRIKLIFRNALRLLEKHYSD